MVSLFSNSISGTHRAQLTCNQRSQLRLLFMAPPRFGHNEHLGLWPTAHGRQYQEPFGMRLIP
uniref:Uncharacterized protein n=1 Tax=Romanomermis culicivorax TaxID=13658 RepID=A0A915L9M5_ROMCU